MSLVRTLEGKVQQAARLAFSNSIYISNDSLFIVEYPKSGGSWLGQLVSDYLEMPFPRNRMPIVGQSVVHSHYLPKYRIPQNKILWLVRDGRDVLVSYYYHQLVWNEKNKLDPKTVSYARKQLAFEDYDDIKTNLPAFIDYTFTHIPSKLHYFNFPGNWAEYNNQWKAESLKKDREIFMVKYEDLLIDTGAELRRILTEFLGVEPDESKVEKVVAKYSFANQSKRKPGETDTKSFLRKGIAGDWKNQFTEEAKDCFKKHASQTLIDLGYENNTDW